MIYFIQPGDTPEYLEDLRKRGFFPVQINVDEEFEKARENTVITAVSFDATDPRNYLNPGSAPAHLTTDTTTDPNNWADGPTFTVNWPESSDTTPKEYKLVLVDGEPLKLVPLVDADTTVTDTTDTSTDPNNWADGPTFTVNWPESSDTTPKEYKLVLVDGEPLKLVPLVDADTTTDPNNYVEGPLSLSELEKLRIPDNVEWNTLPADTTVTDTTDTSDTSEIPADVAAEIDALPKGLVDLNKEYIAARDELIAKTGKEPNSAEVFSYMVEQAKSGKNQSETTVSADTTVTDTTNNVTAQNADPGLCGPQPQIITIDPEKLEEMEKVKVRLAGFGEGPVHFHLFYDSEETDTPSRFELVRIGDSDWTNEQIASYATSMIEKNDYWNEQQKALMREAVDEFRANPKMAQSYYEYQRSLTIISTMDAETEAVTSVQVASAEDDGWRTIGTLNNPDGIDWKYQAGNLTGSGTASVVWHAQELGALGVWTDGTDNWTAVDGWFDANWTMLGCGDFDGDGKDSVLMSLYGGLFYSVDLDGTLTSLGDLNWSGWDFGVVGDFAGDGRDDIVLLHRESGTVVLLADGNADSFERLGQLDASDWSVAGAGDFDGDGKDDLLVRQNSTGIAGAYASADMSKWSTVSSDYLLA